MGDEGMPVDPFHDHDHDACTAAMLDAAEQRSKKAGARLTPVRRRALEILLETHRAMGAYEVLQRLSEDGFGNQPPVAYRALDFLVEQGLAHRVQRLNAYTACHTPGHDHSPAFLICRNCETVAEADTPELHEALKLLAAKGDFLIERRTIELLGLCPACRAAGADTAGGDTPGGDSGA